MLLGNVGLEGVCVRCGMDANAAMGIVQRMRLNKLRHVEVDVVDTGTTGKDVVALGEGARAAQAERHGNKERFSSRHGALLGEQLHLAYASGRAAIAQKFHSVGEIGNLSRVPGLLAGVLGGKKRDCGIGQQGRGISAADKKKQKDQARMEDTWAKEGQGGRWTRVHKSAR